MSEVVQPIAFTLKDGKEFTVEYPELVHVEEQRSRHVDEHWQSFSHVTWYDPGVFENNMRRQLGKGFWKTAVVRYHPHIGLVNAETAQSFVIPEDPCENC